jgi:dihydrofolate reductase
VRKLIYSMGVSLDGFIAGLDGEIDWTAPDEELFRFHVEQVRAIDTHLLGRRLYETMRYWDTAQETNPSAPEDEHEFARIWTALRRLVFSHSLEQVEGGAELVRGDLAETVAELKAQSGGDIAVGGAGLAASLMPLGLIDEYWQFVYPIVLGAGTPYFPPLDARIPLRLVETRTFGSEVVFLRHELAASSLDAT